VVQPGLTMLPLSTLSFMVGAPPDGRRRLDLEALHVDLHAGHLAPAGQRVDRDHGHRKTFCGFGQVTGVIGG
jgi:hypothetical protein